MCFFNTFLVFTYFYMFFVLKDQTFNARMQTSGSICIESFKDFPQMGRFTLRDEGKTIAVGKVLRVHESKWWSLLLLVTGFCDDKIIFILSLYFKARIYDILQASLFRQRVVYRQFYFLLPIHFFSTCIKTILLNPRIKMNFKPLISFIILLP